MKKIVFFVSSLERPGGIEKVTSTISSALSRYAEVEILTINNDKSFFDIDASIKVSTLNKSCSAKRNIISYLGDIVKIYLYIKRAQPDYVICLGASLLLWLLPTAILFGKTNIVLWEHFSTSYLWNKITAKFSRKLAVRICSSIIVLNKEDQLYYEKLGGQGVVIIPNPIRMPSVISERKKIVLAIGRLVEVKGFDLLLKSWQLIGDTDGWVLYIVGEGGLKDHLQHLICKYNLLESVFLYPATDNVDAYYNQAAIFALSSRSECLPMVLLEAASYGMTLVGYDCSDGVRSLIKDRYNGYTIEPGNIIDFAKKLKHLIKNDNLISTMGNNSVIIAQDYSLERIVQQWVQLFA